MGNHHANEITDQTIMSDPTPANTANPEPPVVYSLLIGDIPEGERPRERLYEMGATAVSQRELLAIILRVGTRGLGALALADVLLQRFGGLSGLARASLHDLEQVHGMGRVKAIEIKAAIELGLRVIKLDPNQTRTQIKAPADAEQAFRLEMGALEQEEVWVMALDRRNRVLSQQMIYRGSANAIGVRMAEIFKYAIRQNAQSIIVAHNHPSGDPTPSGEDIAMTRSLVKSGKLLDIEVLDHLVIAQHDYVSMKERGYGFEE